MNVMWQILEAEECYSFSSFLSIFHLGHRLI